MILNQLTNHVREIVLALRTEPVEVPDFITGILDAFARYETGVMGHSVSIPALLKRAKAYFYNGLDSAHDIQDNRLVERHFAFWKHAYVNVSIPGTLLKQVVGLTTDQLTQQDMTLGHMNDTNMYQLLNILDTEYMAAASGIQEKKVAATHGHYQVLEPDEEQRKPESLDDLFDEEADFHGVAIDGLGVYDRGHVWGRRPISNVGAVVDGVDEKKMIHRPQVYQFAADTKPSIASLEPLLRQYAMVVKGGKLGYMWAEGFSTLVQDILGKNLMVPQLVVGGAGWMFDQDCVKIAGTTIIADPNAEPGELKVMHVGSPGMMNGTVFPLYFDPMAAADEYFAMKAKMMSANAERPKGMDFGTSRPTPYQPFHWTRSDSHVDAIYSRVLLDWIPVLCVMRSNQLKIKRLVE